MINNSGFWDRIDRLLLEHRIVIENKKGSKDPDDPTSIYAVDYGFLEGTGAIDGEGVDLWLGSMGTGVDAILCTVDLLKSDVEIKLLVGCTKEETQWVMDVVKRYPSLGGLLIIRSL